MLEESYVHQLKDALFFGNRSLQGVARGYDSYADAVAGKEQRALEDHRAKLLPETQFWSEMLKLFDEEFAPMLEEFLGDANREPDYDDLELDEVFTKATRKLQQIQRLRRNFLLGSLCKLRIDGTPYCP